MPPTPVTSLTGQRDEHDLVSIVLFFSNSVRLLVLSIVYILFATFFTICAHYSSTTERHRYVICHSQEIKPAMKS